jgi:hypothetical protein
MHKPNLWSTAGFLLIALLWVSFAPAVTAGENPGGGQSKPRLQQRIDFGNAQILGQSIKSGAVYLMHRKKSDIQNMIEVRQDYRDEISEDFDLGETAITKRGDGEKQSKNN